MESKQIEEIATLKANHSNMATNIEDIKDDIKEIKNFMTVDFPHMMEKRRKEMDEIYASKMTERIVYAICGMILIGALTKLLDLLSKVP